MAENPIANESADSDVLIDKIAEKLESVTRLDSSKPPSFSDLPNEILGEIVEKLDLVSRLQTRKVSRRLRTVVDNQRAYYDLIEIHIKRNRVDILFDEVMVHYSKNECLNHNGNRVDSFKHKFIKDDNFLEIALNDLAIALKKPKFQLKIFDMSFEYKADVETAEILNFFKSLKSPIHVKSLHLKDVRNSDIVPILSLLKPGTLEGIDIYWDDTELHVNELVKMNQWKLAKRVQIDDHFERSIPVDIEDFIHFDRIGINVDSITPKEVLRLRDVYSKSTSFKGCYLDFTTDSEDELLEQQKSSWIGRALGATVVQTEYGPIIVHRHPIPGSQDFLEFDIDKRGLTIERKP